MEKDQDIIIENGLSVMQIRGLLQVTHTMARAINEEEFKEIMSVYHKATNRLLSGIEI